MKYCPRCGIEQRCGCDECHRCGAKLEEWSGHQVGTIRGEKTATRREASFDISRKESVGDKAQAWYSKDSKHALAGDILLLIVFLAGVCLVLFSLLEAANRADSLIRDNYGLALLGSGKNIGYFIGSIIYGTSLRFVIGFVFLLYALFTRPPLPFNSFSPWEKCVFSVCAAMSLLFLAGLVSLILMIAPGRQSLIVKNFLPPLIISVPAIIAFCLFMIITALLSGQRLLSMRPANERNLEEKAEEIGEHLG